MTFLLVVLLVVAALPWIIEALRKPMNASVRADSTGKFAALPQGVTYYE